VYEVAWSVAACLRAGTRVDLGWVVASRGISSRYAGEAVAITPGGGRIGTLLSGALNEQLADRADRGRTNGRVELRIGPLEAELAGLPVGGGATCLLVAAADLPAELWDRLGERQPVALVTRLDGDRVLDTTLLGPDTIDQAGEDAARLFARGTSDTLVEPDRVVTILWPVPRLVVVGAGGVAEALTGMADLLGWHRQILSDASSATGVIAGLAAIDKVVVTSHDDDIAGPALAAALAGPVGYIGALGSRRVQQSRADWLAYRGVTDLSRVHGPAGLDIGATTPAEIAVSIVAEALATRASSAPSG
jgi:xanthine dehydrogenase accessory factor